MRSAHEAASAVEWAAAGSFSQQGSHRAQKGPCMAPNGGTPRGAAALRRALVGEASERAPDTSEWCRPRTSVPWGREAEVRLPQVLRHLGRLMSYLRRRAAQEGGRLAGHPVRVTRRIDQSSEPALRFGAIDGTDGTVRKPPSRLWFYARPSLVLVRSGAKPNNAPLPVHRL